MSCKAAIDIGTNSVRLLVAYYRDGRLVPVRKELITTRLGEGVHHSGQLSESAMARTVQAVQQMVSLARQCEVDEIAAIATSAVRDARNRQEFLRLCQEAADVTVTVLAGQVEGELSFAGAVMDQPVQGSRLVIDIGGGSTELALGQGTELTQATSLDLGAVRLKDLFPAVGVGQVIPLAAVEQYVREALVGAIPVSAVTRFIGVGGTVTSLGAIDQQLSVYDGDKVHGYFLSACRVQALVAQLAGLTLAERKGVAGLQSERADIIVYGAAILDCLLRWYQAEGIYVSEQDIVAGVIERMVAGKAIG